MLSVADDSKHSLVLRVGEDVRGCNSSPRPVIVGELKMLKLETDSVVSVPWTVDPLRMVGYVVSGGLVAAA